MEREAGTRQCRLLASRVCLSAAVGAHRFWVAGRSVEEGDDVFDDVGEPLLVRGAHDVADVRSEQDVGKSE